MYVLTNNYLLENNEEAAVFFNEFRSRFGTEPDLDAFQAYESIMLLAQAYNEVDRFIR